MKYAIIGSGVVGAALARIFAQKNIDVAIANTRGPETLAPIAAEFGPNINPVTAEEAYRADTIFIATQYAAAASVGKAVPNWDNRIVVDLTNAFRAAPAEHDTRLSSEIIEAAFTGARLVKAFNHLPVRLLGTDATRTQQTVFVSSNHDDASATIAELATQLGFAPIELGRLNEGGKPLHVIDGKNGGLLFKNLYEVR